MGPPPTKERKDNGLFAPVEFVDLEERIGYEAYSRNSVTLSITKPTIYREVIDPKPISFTDQNLLVLRKPQRNECTVRVTTSFNLTVTITDFNRPNQKFNRFFDAVSLRYLFKEGDRHEFKPNGDAMVQADVTEGRTKGTETVAGLSASGGQVTPSLEFHIQQGQSINVQRKMTSWRRGVSMERWPPVQNKSVLSYLDRLSDQLKPADSTNFQRIKVDEIRAKYDGVDPDNHPKHARRHRSSSRATSSSRSKQCPWSSDHYYDLSVHWCWQTCLNLHVWAPEVYQSVSFPVTVMRCYTVEEWENNKRWKCHFDFEVEIYLRSMGHAMNYLQSKDRPADERFVKDAGKPLPDPDRFAFCISCSKDDFENLPDVPTVDLQEVTKDQIRTEEQIYGETSKHVWNECEQEGSYIRTLQPEHRASTTASHSAPRPFPMPPPRPYYGPDGEINIGLHSRPRPYLDPQGSSFQPGRRYSSSYRPAYGRPPPIIIDGPYASRPPKPSFEDDDSEFEDSVYLKPASYERRSRSADETRRRDREDLRGYFNAREERASKYTPRAPIPQRERAYVDEEFEIRKARSSSHTPRAPIPQREREYFDEDFEIRKARSSSYIPPPPRDRIPRYYAERRDLEDGSIA